MIVNGMIVTPYVVVLAGILGLVMGSFINCWAWRSLHGESIFKGHSHCTSCNHVLGARDLIPIVSWIASRGKCRYCGEKVSIRYPLTELITCIAFTLIAYVYGLSWETLELLIFASVLLFLTLTDLEAYVIPNSCIIVALVVRLIYLGYLYFANRVDLYYVLYYVGSAIGMAVVLVAIVLIADRVLGRESMGGGDLKLFAVAGLYFGWQQGIYLIILSCLIGILFSVFTKKEMPLEMEEAEDGGEPSVKPAEADSPEEKDVEQISPTSGDSAADVKARQQARRERREKKQQSKPFPFGPAIAAACIITMLIGQPFVSWYLGLLGL